MKQILKLKISNEFDQIAATRCLYIDPNLLQIINFIYDFKFQAEGPQTEIIELEYVHEAIDVSKAANIICFLYPVPKMIDVIASMILKNEVNNVKKNYYMYFVPMINYLCIEELELKQIKDKVKVKNFTFDLIPINDDLFSLEIPAFLDPLEQ